MLASANVNAAGDRLKGLRTACVGPQPEAREYLDERLR